MSHNMTFNTDRIVVAREISRMTARELADLPPYHPATDDFLPRMAVRRERKGFRIRWPWPFSY
ncbi:MAG: hypothetical protein WAU86_11825 [Oricola sp.]